MLPCMEVVASVAGTALGPCRGPRVAVGRPRPGLTGAGARAWPPSPTSAAWHGVLGFWAPRTSCQWQAVGTGAAGQGGRAWRGPEGFCFPVCVKMGIDFLPPSCPRDKGKGSPGGRAFSRPFFLSGISLGLPPATCPLLGPSCLPARDSSRPGSPSLG